MSNVNYITKTQLQKNYEELEIKTQNLQSLHELTRIKYEKQIKDLVAKTKTLKNTNVGLTKTLGSLKSRYATLKESNIATISTMKKIEEHDLNLSKLNKAYVESNKKLIAINELLENKVKINQGFVECLESFTELSFIAKLKLILNPVKLKYYFYTTDYEKTK